MADDMVTARVHPSIKKKLQSSGYTARQAIEYFVRDYYNSNPRKRVEVKRQILENDLEMLKKQECEIQLEIEHKESLIDKLVVGEVTGVDNVDEKEGVHYELPPNVQKGINIIQSAFNNKKDLECSSTLSDKENIDNFIRAYEEFIVRNYDEYFSELGFREFKELLYSEIKV